jgi:hypothetical protein
MRISSGGRVSKAPEAADVGHQWQRARKHLAGRRSARRAAPGPKPRGKEAILRLQRVHSPDEAKDNFGGKFVTPYEIAATAPIGIKAEWTTHEACNGDVLVLKEVGSDRVRRPISGANLRLPGQPGIVRER